MKYGIHCPNFGTYGDPRLLVELGREAEEAGWDGYFLWDHLLWKSPVDQPVADPWVTLTGMAMVTSTLRLGTLITPLPRRRPWTVARQVVTLDHLSGGRVVLGAGIGGDWYGDYSAFGESPHRKTHGEMLDEALAIIDGLWRGEHFSFTGKHFRVEDALFVPRPLQQPRIPIWIAGLWPNRKPFRRAAQWDGVVPEGTSDYGYLKPQDIRDLIAEIQTHRTAGTPFDVVFRGETPGGDGAAGGAIVAPYAEAGVTWWLEHIADERGTLTEMRERIRQGPPKG
jgi:alkanesulfonate monooxygenase SsuD/methylene tetrahydromethanopterin reductase-like flavin-dependent oxidoreductase (luciferase family)